MTSPNPDVSVVILTRGDRPDELVTALDSVWQQYSIDAEVVLVANGVSADDIAVPAHPRLHIVETAENVGIPGGRNRGAHAATAPVIAFLDDDARFTDPAVLRRAVDSFGRDSRLAAVALHIVDECGATARRHIPRPGSRGADRSGPVTGFLGGAVVLRASAMTEVGGYADEFFYAMEETDLTLRLIDRGWTLWYDGAASVFHPATAPARHEGAALRTLRNRIWLAHRNLPWPVALTYVANWLIISSLRQPRTLPAQLRSVAEAWRTRPGPRRPIGWRTVLRLTRLGRPPIV